MSVDARRRHLSIEVGRTIAGLDPAELVAAVRQPALRLRRRRAAGPRGGAARGAAGSGRDRLRLQGQQLAGGAGHAARRPAWVRTWPRAVSCARCCVRASGPSEWSSPVPARPTPSWRPRSRRRRRAHHRVARRARRGHRPGGAGPCGPGPDAAPGHRRRCRGPAHHQRPGQRQVRPHRRGGGRGRLAPARARRRWRPEGPFVLRGFHAFGASNVLDASGARRRRGRPGPPGRAHRRASRSGARAARRGWWPGHPLHRRRSTRSTSRPGAGPGRGDGDAGPIDRPLRSRALAAGARALAGRVRPAPTSAASRAPRSAAAASWPSATAASTTCCDHAWSARTTGSCPWGCRRATGPTRGSTWSVRSAPASTSWPPTWPGRAARRRPLRRPRRRRLRLQRVDAALPLAPDPGRDRRRRWRCHGLARAPRTRRLTLRRRARGANARAGTEASDGGRRAPRARAPAPCRR